MYISFLLLYYFFNIQIVTFKWKSLVFSGKFKEFCSAIPSVLKPWWQSNMHWVNSNWIGCDTKPPERDGWVSIFPDYLFKHTFYRIISDLFTLRFDCCPFSLFPFPVSLFLCFSPLPVIWLSVPQFSKLGITWRRCTSLYHHVCSEVYQCSVLKCDLYNNSFNGLEEVVDSSSLQKTPEWGAPVSTLKARAARQIELDRLEEGAYRNLLKGGLDKQQAAHELCSTEGEKPPRLYDQEHSQ